MSHKTNILEGNISENSDICKMLFIHKIVEILQNSFIYIILFHFTHISNILGMLLYPTLTSTIWLLGRVQR